MSDVEIESRVDVQCTVNGEAVSRTVDPSTTLLEFVRTELGLTGTTEGCGVGVCGCCTVDVDGDPVNACLELAVNANGATIETIEGLGEGDEPDPVQAAFQTEEGFQCGYCTPGMIMMTRSMLEAVDAPDEETIRRFMSENLCRCTGYGSIVDAIDTAVENRDAETVGE